MRKTGYAGSFFVCLILNVILNFRYSIPAWILLILHFVLHISIWWFVAGIGLWVLSVLLWMIVLRWTHSCSNEPKVVKENKNPYSSKGYTPIKSKGSDN